MFVRHAHINSWEDDFTGPRQTLVTIHSTSVSQFSVLHPLVTSRDVTQHVLSDVTQHVQSPVTELTRDLHSHTHNTAALGTGEKQRYSENGDIGVAYII